ncbi:MAG: methyltransferase domain-containing protein [Rhodospirillum sp.]|nr:methyltransferase domain-containing protein [Rhodospirillum sp.]MCF8487642.1 methyltransferase domain-containing protein [Rhodospirillum sp.]MCF8503090.1 methyltransferase domain-containing protein [Rhodospirillum sp.]
MMDSATATRAAALDLLIAVLDMGRTLEDAMGTACKGLAPRDRAFAHLIAATTLRRMARLEKVVKSFLERPLPNKAKDAKHILRLGAAQMLFLDTPPHAAVGTAVSLAKARRMTPYAGLINAVLRKVSKDGMARLEALDAPFADLPRWIGQSWVADHGEETAARIARACGREAPLDLTPRDGDLAALAERTGGEVLTLGSVRLPAGIHVLDLPGFEEGQWWIQDAAAAIPARLLPLAPELRVADLCAAPGGKTLQLAAAGARVTAVDRSESRLARVHENLERMGLADQVEVLAVDALHWAREIEPGTFDAVLVDAPCTATGTFRRHPDAPWLKNPDDAKALAAIQSGLLDAAHRLLRPGGTLVYCVCSLQAEEGEPQVAAALARHGDLSRQPIAAGEAGLDADMLTAEGDVRLFPFHLDDKGGLDGFYMARLVKTAP